ncbi:MAG: filamentous hemagglutinin N-terminal domain-containing protein [Pirellulaceae bacterium]
MILSHRSRIRSALRRFIARGRASRGFTSRLVLPTALAGLLGCVSAAQAQQNGQVVAGSAAISQSGQLTQIQQHSQRAVINWQSFSIPAGNTVRFDQPNSSAAVLNRVTGGDPSAIMGSLQANGNVFLVNPNGIVFGPGARVDVNGIVASTLDLSDSQFMAGGDLDFRGTSGASIINQGTIQALGGDIFLIGASVENHGSLLAPHGTVGLAAGSHVQLVDSSNPSLVVRATPDSIGGTGVLNTGMIDAARAELLANGGNVYALAINNEGTIRATGAEVRDGRVMLVAPGGRIHSSGSISAHRGTDGGDVVLQTGGTPGSEIVVTGSIDVSGQESGGNVGFKAATIDIGSATIDASGATPGLVIASVGPHSVIDTSFSEPGNLKTWDVAAPSLDITSDDGLVKLSMSANDLDGTGTTVASPSPLDLNGPSKT